MVEIHIVALFSLVPLAVEVCPAMSAENLAFQRIHGVGVNLPVFACLGNGVKKRLYAVEQLMGDNGLVCVTDGNEIIRTGFHLLMVNGFGVPLYQVPGIGFAAQDFSYRPCLPLSAAYQIFVGDLPDFLFIMAGRDYARFVQLADDGVDAVTLRCPFKHLLHD